MTGTEGRLRLQLELSDAVRVLPRIVLLVTGRGFVIDRCEYARTTAAGALLRLDVTGPRSAHANLVGRLRQVVGVVDLATLADPDGDAPGSSRFQASRVRASTRIDGDEVVTDVALKVASGDATCLAAGEGSGPVEALVRAFERGADTLHPGVLRDVVVTSVGVGLVGGHATLGSDVHVVLSATDGHEAWCADGTASDIVDATTQAAVRLFGAIVDDRLTPAPSNRTPAGTTPPG